MLALWIILGIFALIALLLSLKLRVFLVYKDDGRLDIYAKYLFFTFRASEEPNEELVQQIFSILGLRDIGSVANARHAIDSKGVSTTLNELCAVLKTLLDRVWWLLRRGVFKQFNLRIAVAEPDAADAAYGYGLVCAAAYPLLGMLDAALRFKKRSIDIHCDFEKEATAVDFLAQFNIRLWPILRALIHVIRENVKRTLETEAQEGRKS